MIRVKRTGSSQAFEAGAVDLIDAAGDYMCIHTGTDTHILRATMRELGQQLDSRRFQRMHRSTIARVTDMRAHINGGYFLILDTGQRLKRSRSYRDKVALLRQRWNSHLQTGCAPKGSIAGI